MAEWRQHPVTKQVRQYLKDYRQQIMEIWAHNDIADEAIRFYTGTCSALEQIEDLDYEDMRDFYQKEDEPHEEKSVENPGD